MSLAAAHLDESYRHCRELTRRAATSFYYAFKTLPRRKSRAFDVIYAFMRVSDDRSDEPCVADRDRKMREWREALSRAFEGDVSADPIMPALMDTVRVFDIRPAWLFDLLDGVEQDLVVTRFETLEALRAYCWKVASVVGLVSLRIFGLEQPSAATWARAEAMGADCGQAFQLTNILRDVKEDLERDRIYLPREILERFDLKETDLAAEPLDARFKAMMAHLADLAERDYAASEELVGMIARDARPCLATMRGIYHGILEKIVEADYDVWSRRARVPLAAKLGIAARAFLGRFGS